MIRTPSKTSTTFHWFTQYSVAMGVLTLFLVELKLLDVIKFPAWTLLVPLGSIEFLLFVIFVKILLTKGNSK